MPIKIEKKVYLDDKTYNVIDTKKGGMGRVWLLESLFNDIYDPIYQKKLAVKTFDFTPQNYEIEQELNSWVGLDHKYIIPLLRIGRLNYRLAAIMPWLQGTLDDELNSGVILQEKVVLDIAVQIVEALQYAYMKYQIVHLDLKPANILIKSRTPLSIQVSDWGISRISSQIYEANWQSVQSENQYTAYGAGTPLYMSPERFLGGWKITPQADMYSFGMMLVQLITGILPFNIKEKSPFEEIITGSYIVNTKQILQLKSKRFEQIIYSCLHPDTSMRPKSYGNLIDELKRC